jgi:hypothetical protein
VRFNASASATPVMDVTDSMAPGVSALSKSSAPHLVPDVTSIDQAASDGPIVASMVGQGLQQVGGVELLRCSPYAGAAKLGRLLGPPRRPFHDIGAGFVALTGRSRNGITKGHDQSPIPRHGLSGTHL